MNGHQVLDNIKSSEFHKEVPVLLLSGHKQSDTRTHVFNLVLKTLY
jgi:response regulator RpfG family c-di-GMP phosphodiesterase